MTPEGITRHLIAVLSADVKDYTRLMSQDDWGEFDVDKDAPDADHIFTGPDRFRVAMALQ